MFSKAFQWFRSLFRLKWRHINYRYDGGKSEVQVYVDGELVKARPVQDKPVSISFWLS